MKTTARIRDNIGHPNHHPTNYCNCPACKEDYEKDCTHPHDCATEAMARIHTTTPKTNPLYPDGGHNNLSLIKRRKEQNRKAKEENRKIPFDPTMISKSDIAECFRVFTNP